MPCLSDSIVIHNNFKHILPGSIAEKMQLVVNIAVADCRKLSIRMLTQVSYQANMK